MAAIDSKKLLPSSGNSKQVFLVPSRSIVPLSSVQKKLKPSDGNRTPSAQFGSIVLRVNNLTEAFENNLRIQRSSNETKRREREQEEFRDKEKQLETKKIGKTGEQELQIPKIPGSSIFDRLKRFVGFSLLGFIFNNYANLLPKLTSFVGILKPAAVGIGYFAEGILSGTIDWIEKGYKAYDFVKDTVKKIGGDNYEQKFDELSGALNQFLNAAAILGLAGISGGLIEPRRFRAPTGGFSEAGGVNRAFRQSLIAASRQTKDSFAVRMQGKLDRAILSKLDKKSFAIDKLFGEGTYRIDKNTGNLISRRVSSLREGILGGVEEAALLRRSGIGTKLPGDDRLIKNIVEDVKRGGKPRSVASIKKSRGLYKPRQLSFGKALGNLTIKVPVEALSSDPERRMRILDQKFLEGLEKDPQLRAAAEQQAAMDMAAERQGRIRPRSARVTQPLLPGLYQTDAGYSRLMQAIQDVPGRPGVFGRGGRRAPKRASLKLFGKAGTKGFSRVPIVGPIIDFGISLAFGDPIGEAGAAAVGSAVGSAIAGALVGAGTFGIGAALGVFVGGFLGDIIGRGLYNVVKRFTGFKDKNIYGKTEGFAKGGQVGGRKGAASRSIKKPEKVPSAVTPQKSQPGKDVGGRKKIAVLYGEEVGGKKGGLNVLLNTASNLKSVSVLNGALGSLMGASVDLAMGQKFDPKLAKQIGDQFGYTIQNMVDTQMMSSIGDISKQVGMANGGVVPSRRIGRNETVGTRIGKMFSENLRAMLDSASSEVLSDIRSAISGKSVVSAPPAGDVLPAEISEDQRKASNDLINYFTKLYGKNAAIGIVANLLRESGLRTSTPDNLSYEGMAQWSRNDRWPKFVSWAQSKGKDPYSRSAQAEWIAIELNQLGTNKRLLKAETPEAAASLFYNEFERAAYSKPILGNRYTPDNPHEQKNRAFVASLTGGSAGQSSMVSGGVKPSNVSSTSSPGWRWGRMHKGVDLDGGDGKPISSAQDAQVIWAGDRGDDYGNSVVLRYSNGSETRFAHLKSFNVSNGQKIKAGQLIGKQGSTGRSTASHLHFEYYPNGGAMSYQGYSLNAASVMDSYFRYGGNIVPKLTDKPADIFKIEKVDPNKPSPLFKFNKKGGDLQSLNTKTSYETAQAVQTIAVFQKHTEIVEVG